MNSAVLKRWMLSLLVVGMIAGPLSMSSLFADEEEEESPLEKQMSEINKGYKLIRRSARKKTFTADDLKAVSVMVDNSAQAMHQIPPMAAKIPADKKAAFLLTYKKMMGKMTKDLIDLEIALEEKKTEVALKIIEGLATAKKDGHEKYTED